MNSKKTVPEISIIVPTYNEEGNIEKLFNEVHAVLANQEYEILFVDDGSSDDSLNVAKKLAKKHNLVRYLSFSRNFGHQAALRAGLRHARGAAVISMDADLQHPPQLLPKLIKKWQAGYEVVYTVRKDTTEIGMFKRYSSSWFYKVINKLANLTIQEGAADFRLLDRKVVDVINSETENNLFLRAYIDWIGFKRIGIEYTPAKRFSGVSKYSMRKMLQFGVNGITQFSIKPLHLAFMLASVAFALSILYIFYAVWAALIAHQAVPGWLSIVVLVVFLQGMQFLLIGLVGEYVGRTFMQTKNRPEFIVSETNCASPFDKTKS